jgi:hypothetical protein
VLRCGHAFCDPCISQWLKTHTNCPICRKDLEDQEEQQPAEQPPASCGAAAGNGVRGQQDVLQQQVRQCGGQICVQIVRIETIISMLAICSTVGHCRQSGTADILQQQVMTSQVRSQVSTHSSCALAHIVHCGTPVVRNDLSHVSRVAGGSTVCM